MPEFRQIKVLQGEIYLYVCCLGSLISFTVTADYPRITGLFNTFSLQTSFVDISLGKLNNRLHMYGLGELVHAADLLNLIATVHQDAKVP